MVKASRTVRILILSAIAIVLLLAGALLLLQTPWARDYLRDFAERKAQAALGTTVSIGGLAGNLVSEVELEHVSIGREGQPIVTAPRIEVDYSLLGLLTGDIGISSVLLHQPVVHIRRTEDGVLNLAALGQDAGASRTPNATGRDKARAPTAVNAANKDASEPVAPATPSGRGWSVEQLAIEDGTVTLGPNVVTADAVNMPDEIVNLDANISLRSRPGGGVLAAIDALSFETVEPVVQVESVSGELAWAPTRLRLDDVSIQTSAGSIALDGTIADRQSDAARYDLTVTADDVDLVELSRIFPALEGYAVTPDLEASVHGRLDELKVEASVDTTAGTAQATAALDLAAPERHVDASLRVRDLNLQPLPFDTPTDITMNAEVDVQVPEGGLSALNGTYSVTAPEFRYGDYRASGITASGQIDGRTISVGANGDFFDGHGEASGTITLPSDDEPISYNLRGRLRDIDAASVPAATSTASALGGLPEGVDADFTLAGQGSDIDASARLGNLSFAGAQFGPGANVKVSSSGGRLRYAAEGTVHDLNLQRVGRAVGIEALTSPRYDSDINAQFDLSGSGTTLEGLSLRGHATLRDAQIFGAHIPRLTVRPDLTHGSGSIAIAGAFADLDLATAVPSVAPTSRLQGDISARMTVAYIAHPSFSPGGLTCNVRLSLGESQVSGVVLDSATVDATVRDGVAHVRQLRLSGPRLMVEASGPLALVPAAESDFDYAIRTSALQQFEAITVPIRGAVRLRGHVAGNPDNLEIEGTLSGTNVGYADDVAAEALETTYEVELPVRAPRELRASARAELTQVTAAGTTVRSVTATANYADQVVGFRTRVEDANRELQAKGRLALGAQELTLDELQLSAGDSTWALSGTEPALIAYQGDALRIHDLVLVSEQGGRISADGELGTPDGPLSVTIHELPLGQIRDLLPQDLPVSGVVEGTADVSGSIAAPAIDATVGVTNGSYRGFAFERVGGTFHVTRDLLELDARVVQDAAASLTAVGTIPLSAEAAKGLEVHVESTPINLGLLQTFTDEIQQVKGTAEMDVTVRGTRSSPTLHGSLHVRNGEFTVTVAQSHYTGFDTDITFDGTTARISELRLVDDEDHRLRIGGRLPLTGGTAAGVNLRIHSDNFEFADNRLAELNADTDLTVTGDLLRPRIQGTLAIRESLIHVDRILELSRGPYDVDSGSTTDREPALFEPIVDVGVRIPDTLLIRGSDLRAPNGIAVGLGDVNVTIGGDLRLRKQPGAALQVTGELQTVRGQYEFQGRQFAIERDGRVVFMGGPELNPRLDIEAVREISGVTASVHIGGVLDAPELSLSSQPPMDDAEILSLIVFNQPLSLVGTGAQVSLAARATALAAGFATSQLTKSLSNALEVDLLELEATTSDGTVAPALTVGEQFGQLFVKLRQRFGPEQVSEAIVEYRLAEWLRLQSNYVHSDVVDRNLVQRIKASGLDLLFLFSY
jgi:autotransporter translocation and assembly factor TamB